MGPRTDAMAPLKFCGIHQVLVLVTVVHYLMVDAYVGNASEPAINVALTAREVTCSSVLEPTQECAKAVDGTLIAPDGEWVSNGEGVGAWIKSNLFVEMPLPIVTGSSYTDYAGQLWDGMDLNDVITSWVNIEITAVHSRINNGFYELEFFEGTYICPTPYSLVHGRCYRYELTTSQPWVNAQRICVNEHATLVAIETPDERNALTAWLLRSFRMDQAFIWTLGKHSTDGWRWGEAEADWFDWEPNQPSSGDMAAWSSDSWQLVSKAQSEQTYYICEYKTPHFLVNYAKMLYGDINWSPLQDGVRDTCLNIDPTLEREQQILLVWHTDSFTRMRVFLWWKHFEVSPLCGSFSALMFTSNYSVSRMAVPPCRPFCGTLVSCSTVKVKAGVEVLECACPTNACRDIALTFMFHNGPEPLGPIEVCHLDLLYLE